MSSHEDILSKLNPEIVTHFLRTGDCHGIPKDTQQWIREIQIAYEVYYGDGTTKNPEERNIQKASKKIQQRLATEKIQLSLRQCQTRIYSALRYFNVDATVPDKIWQLDYANKYSDIAKDALADGEYAAAIKATELSQISREKASEAANLETGMGIIFLISNDIDIIEDLKYEKKSLKEIARKHSDGFYHNFINALPIDQKEKLRLKNDAELTEFEEIESD